MNPHLTGLIAAPFTPMTPDGGLNLPMVEKLAGSLVANTISGAFVCGSTGESMSLSVAERMALAGRWQEVAAGHIPIIVHVGHTSLPEARALAAHAGEIGAFAVAAMAPPFFRPRTLEALVMWCEAVAAAAGEVPFYYYHLPSLTGAAFGMYDFLQLAGPRIPNLAGIKFTHCDLMDYLRCLRFEAGRYNMLFGVDEQLLAGLATGAAGAVGSTYNYSAPLYRRIIDAYQAGDMVIAQRTQLQAANEVAILVKYGGLATGKAIMKLIGLDVGPPRLPLCELGDDQVRQLRADLEQTGFFNACSR